MARELFVVDVPLRADLPAARALIGSPRFLELWSPDLSVVRVDRQPGLVSIQGGWWYRGEMSVTDRPALRHRVLDVSGAPRWRVLAANRGFVGYRSGLEQRVRSLAAAMERELGSSG